MQTSSLKVAFIVDWLTGLAGGEQVLVALHQLYPEAPIYTSLWRPEKTQVLNDTQIIPSALQKIPGLSKHHQIAVPLMPAAFEGFDLKGYDLIISIGPLSKGVITHPGQLHLNYCHTPIRYLWHFGGDNRADGWLRSRLAHRMRIWDVLSSMRVDQFIANSHTVAERIQKIYRRSATVIYPPVQVERFQDIPRQPQDYYLTIGRLVAYKRVDLLIEACIASGRRLKISGSGPDEARLRSLAAKHPHIELLGRVPDQEFRQLFSGARAFLFAAEEDFGIAPVEAMSAGCPVIAYGKGGATESVIPHKTGLLYPEPTSSSLNQAIDQFESLDKEQAWTRNSEAIRQQASQFSQVRFLDSIREFIDSHLTPPPL